MYQPFGSFPYKWISVAEACRYFQDAQMNSSLGLKKIRTCYSEEDAEPWQHLSRSRVLRCFHQQCINQHMVVLWYVDRRWGVSINCIGLQFELKPILLLFEPNTFLVRILSFYSQVCCCFVPAISDPFLTRELMWRLKRGVRSTWTRVALDAARVPRMLLCDIARVMI